MTNNQVEIFVPYDSGFAGGDTGPWIDALFFLGYCLGWLRAPFETWKQERIASIAYKEWKAKNVSLGKNPDGSWSKKFPETTTLREALTTLELDVLSAELLPKSVVLCLGQTPVGELTSEEISKAVTECQIVNW